MNENDSILRLRQYIAKHTDVEAIILNHNTWNEIKAGGMFKANRDRDGVYFIYDGIAIYRRHKSVVVDLLEL